MKIIKLYLIFEFLISFPLTTQYTIFDVIRNDKTIPCIEIIYGRNDYYIGFWERYDTKEKLKKGALKSVKSKKRVKPNI